MVEFGVEGLSETASGEESEDCPVDRADPGIARERTCARRTTDEFVVSESKSAANDCANNKFQNHNHLMLPNREAGNSYKLFLRQAALVTGLLWRRAS